MEKQSRVFTNGKLRSMRKYFLLSVFLFIGCSTFKSISNDNLYNATKDVVRIENIASQLSQQANVDRQFNAKEKEILSTTLPDLVDELDKAIEYEKQEKYNEGLKVGYDAGYKQALIDIVEKYKNEE